MEAELLLHPHSNQIARHRSEGAGEVPGIPPAKTSDPPKQTTGLRPGRLLAASKTLLQNVILFEQARVFLCET